MHALLTQIRQCTVCAAHLPLGPRPVLSADPQSRVLLIGQAPGTRVHHTGIPWNDPSGDTLRAWLQMEKEDFYDAQQIAIVPMGFCYPGKGKAGDLPPRPECAPLWHPPLAEAMTEIRLTLLIGQYAQRYYLGHRFGQNLTATVQAYQDYLPQFFPLPHPSPRNRLWLKRNPWFETDVLPVLRARMKEALG